MFGRNICLVGAAMLMLVGAPALAKPLKGHALLHKAHLTLAQARATALAARPGKVTDEELEQEKGGSGLRYSFDIKDKGGVTREVGVDAVTGAVLENSTEGPHAD